eukprot:s2050_g17.t1
MDDYADRLLDPPLRPPGQRHPLQPNEKKWIGTICGQLNWMARQCRAGLSFGVSRVQQLAGVDDPAALAELQVLVDRARVSTTVKYEHLGCDLKQMVVICASDASFAGMPRGRSQGGCVISMANPEILEGTSKLAVLQWHSGLLKRVVRSSLAAEISQAAVAMEEGDFCRALLAEMTQKNFSLSCWLPAVAIWKLILVLDSRTGYDLLNGTALGEDKRLAIDISATKQALQEDGASRLVRWVPGEELIADDLTKLTGNGKLMKVLASATWALRDTEAPTAPAPAPVRRDLNAQNRDRVMPAVEMKPRPANIVLEQLVPSVPSVPGALARPPPSAPTGKQNRMMPAVPEAQRQNHGTGSTDPNWVSLSSIGEGSNMFPVKRQSEDAGCVSHGSTLEPPGRCTSSTLSEGSAVGSAENRSSLASLDDCMEEDPVLATMRHEEQNAPNDADVKDKTSLFLRNLPLDYGQQKTIDFIDSQGYRDTYDLLLWFPSKKSSHRKTSSVFINFRSCEWAQKFAEQLHQLKPDGVDAKLNISTAFYQGFAANFVKYWHLTQEDGNGSICRPFIAEDQLEKVSDETMRKAQQVREAMKKDRTVLSSEWTATTLVIRNLPQQIDTQEKAMKWLDESGFGHTYDFLLYFPRKSNSANKLKSLAYVFVNFVDSATAKVCLETLPQKVSDGMPLSVVTSNIQGKEACIQRFRLVADSGRLIPFSEDISQRQNQELEESRGMLWQ